MVLQYNKIRAGCSADCYQLCYTLLLFISFNIVDGKKGIAKCTRSIGNIGLAATATSIRGECLVSLTAKISIENNVLILKVGGRAIGTQGKVSLRSRPRSWIRVARGYIRWNTSTWEVPDLDASGLPFHGKDTSTYHITAMVVRC